MRISDWSSDVCSSDLVFERNPVAGVLPYDPVQDAVVLLEQFRTGPMAAKDDNPWLIEIVAGIIEDGETPEDMARREATEEAGCTITDRSEEHTSELQSLMRTSDDVFGLTKEQNNQSNARSTTISAT